MTPTALSPAHTAKGHLQRVILRLLRVHERDGDLPTNPRFLFYELEHLGEASKDLRPIKPGCKMARRGDQEMHDALTHLREIGLVPWGWILDETRTAHSFRTAATVADYVLDAVDYALIDRWDGEPAPQILCESRSLAGVLYRTAALYACPIASTNGQARGFLINEVAPTLEPGQRVLYLGDWDLCGNHIEAATKRTLVEHADGWDENLWERVALTTEQVAELNEQRHAEGLPSAIIRKRDYRFCGNNGKRGKFFDAVETEALGQGVIVSMLRTRLDELMPEPLADVLEREEQQRAEVAEQLRRLQP